MKQQIDPTRDQ